MSILDFIGGIFKPVSDLVDNVHTSTEEKMELQNKLAELQAGLQTKFIELEGKAIDAMAKVQVAEAQSEYWITANWRPVSSLMMVTVVTLAAFHVIPKPDPEFYELAKVFLGFYTGGRSAEKIGQMVVGKLGK